MGQAMRFYESLGFVVDVQSGGGYGLVLHEGREWLHLSGVEDLDRDHNRAAAYFFVDDAADWHDRWLAEGVEVTPVIDASWGMREFRLRDLDNNLLRLGQNL